MYHCKYTAQSILCSTICMQMVSLYKDPTGKDVLSKTIQSGDDKSEVGQLRGRVRQLERRLTEVCDCISKPLVIAYI